MHDRSHAIERFCTLACYFQCVHILRVDIRPLWSRQHRYLLHMRVKCIGERQEMCIQSGLRAEIYVADRVESELKGRMEKH